MTIREIVNQVLGHRIFTLSDLTTLQSLLDRGKKDPIALDQLCQALEAERVLIQCEGSPSLRPILSVG